MNLHLLVRNAISVVNPTKVGKVKVNTGIYTTEIDGSRTPSYVEYDNIPLQVQSISSRDLVQVNQMNIGGADVVIYLYGRIDGISRLDNKGGDLVCFDDKVWLVTGLLEHWDNGVDDGWSKVSATAQLDAPW